MSFSHSSKLSATPSRENAFEQLATEDGSITFFSPEFDQPFHSPYGALAEALEKYILPCQLRELAAQTSEIHILDVCFGLGYNTAVALAEIWKVNPDCRIQLLLIERSPLPSQQALSTGLWSQWSFEQELGQLIRDGYFEGDRLEGRIHWGDARQTIKKVPTAWADAIFLDPFSPAACPELWTADFLAMVAARLNPAGLLATYSCAAAVRSALLEAGLTIGSSPPFGRPWPGTVAAYGDRPLPPISQMEQEHLKTRAAVPYRDPSLAATAETIRTTRQKFQDSPNCQLESTTAWKKRWWYLAQRNAAQRNAAQQKIP